MKNLFYDSAHQGRVLQLRAKLLDWLVRTRRPVTAHRSSAPPGGDGKTPPERLIELCGKGLVNYLWPEDISLAASRKMRCVPDLET